MVRPKAVKDRRVAKKRAAKDFTALVENIMTGETRGRPGAEVHAFACVKWLVQLYLMGEGALPDELRALVAALMDREDPLRRDIDPDTWAMLFPALNTLTHARREAVETARKAHESEEQQREAARTTPPPGEDNHGQREEGRQVEGEGGTSELRPGILGAGAGEAGHTAGEVEGGR